MTRSMPDSRKLWLPPRFIEDCHECGCDVGEVIETRARRVLLEATDTQLAELYDRAKHYASPAGPDAAPRGLNTAAHALLRALHKDAQ